jgi:hypothetical protein
MPACLRPAPVSGESKRLEVSAKQRIKAINGLGQLVCDELAASNGQTAPGNDGSEGTKPKRDECTLQEID